jgi:hypothetical protein
MVESASPQSYRAYFTPRAADRIRPVSLPYGMIATSNTTTSACNATFVPESVSPQRLTQVSYQLKSCTETLRRAERPALLGLHHATCEPVQ